MLGIICILVAAALVCFYLAHRQYHLGDESLPGYITEMTTAQSYHVYADNDDFLGVVYTQLNGRFLAVVSQKVFSAYALEQRQRAATPLIAAVVQEFNTREAAFTWLREHHASLQQVVQSSLQPDTAV